MQLINHSASSKSPPTQIGQEQFFTSHEVHDIYDETKNEVGEIKKTNEHFCVGEVTNVS